jgi:hypothetical protein
MQSDDIKNISTRIDDMDVTFARIANALERIANSLEKGISVKQ